MATAVAEDDALWAAVADPTRRRVLDALLEQGEATTTTLAQGLPVTRQAVAKHLVVLNRVGLVKRWLAWPRSGTGAWHGSSGSPSPYRPKPESIF